MRVSTALLFTGLAAQQASATWNRHAGYFKNPQYNNNECSDKQKDGFNWHDLPEGNFGGYGDFDFKGGWSCKNKFGKRDSLTKRTFNSKCVTNKVRKDKPASFDCKKRKEGFSIKEIQVSVEFDCDVEFHYKMPDKSICKHVAPCKKDGTIVQNTQCGGAEEVDVYLGHHNEKDRDDCEIGFHHIEFDCNPPYQPPGKPPKTSDVESTKPATTTTEEVPSSTSAPVVSTTSDKVESSTTSDKVESSTTTDKVESSTTTDKVESSTTTEEVKTTSPPVDTPYSTLPPYSNSTTTHPPPESSAATTDVPPPSSSTDIPGYSQPPSKETTSDVPPPSSTSEAVPTTTSPPTGGYTPPDVLPKCMDTWLEINTECKDNTDCNCYCKNPDFTKNVIDCVAAWSTDAKIKEALKYLQGICAPYVPENPGIVTHTVPGYNEPTPPPTTETTGGYAPPVPTGPVTTITYKTTATVPCTDNCYGGTTTTVISTEVTVPQVYFPTPPADNPSTTAPIELIPGTPPPVPAQTTGGYAPPYPVPSSLTTTVVPSGTGGYSAPPPLFTGAASRAQVGFVAGLGAVAALFAL